ncbi:MAG TPA: hypothetical protein VJT49_31510 [Amycolatopsis sp.]|uniref:phage shock envelope stress response protein PspM n=1 Tax=Amycolatopsis sp. TaxID=37632 RepID=UPI002B4833DD|nr:hypothetical protein [Amycolatopsis sp.]HKS49559.1 hypothetical protein [Amycolatopsis sp.]
MPGRRDFGELSAKLEKHVERLPEYAQRAQEKLQRYLPPPAEQAGRRPNPLVRPKAGGDSPSGGVWGLHPQGTRPPSITDVPVVAEVRAKWLRWNDPAARLERRKRRTSRALTLWVLLTLLCGVLAVAAGAGLLVAHRADTALAGVVGMVVFGTLGVRSGLRLRQLNRTKLPVSTAPTPLPPAGSTAREPMRRLAECEESLAELLRQLSTPSAVGTTPVPEISVEDARATAADAATALRGLAARVQAVERARDSAPRGERGALDAAVRTLCEQLDDGLEGYRALVAAAGHAVAASSSGMRESKDALTDATDRLAGLAIALKELS